jgi:hypothetical protein
MELLIVRILSHTASPVMCDRIIGRQGTINNLSESGFVYVPALKGENIGGTYILNGFYTYDILMKAKFKP